MDIESFNLLFTKDGRAALAAAMQLQPDERDFLSHFQNLEKQYPSQLAKAALETAILRKEAVRKFSHPEAVYLTREALEQASPYAVSQHRCERYRIFDSLLDLGCSIGSDTINMGRVSHTIGVDNDQLRLAMAHANADALGLSGQIDFIQADLANPLPFKGSESCGLFFDPARRSGGRRIFSVENYQPSLRTILEWLKSFPAMGVKISPGVKKSEIDDFDAELEFVSLDGELKEALLWFGALKTAARRATVLPGPHTLYSDIQSGQLSTSEPRAFIYEPDAAVIRAGLVSDLGDQLGAFQLDPDIAYLTADKEIQTPFARFWEVEDWLPFNVKRLREYLRTRNVGDVTVKKRGSPIQPEALIQMLRLRGTLQRVLFLTHLNGSPIVIVGLPKKISP
jgi:hypothetical protein